MDEVRTALLIGVARAPDALPQFTPLDEPVEADLNGLRAALEESGYGVQVLKEAGRAEIGARIFEVSRAVPAGGTLLVYFTGHGVRLGETDYLIPADARAPDDGDWRAPYRDSLLPADISGYLSECRAGTVLWVLDACRNGISGSHAAFGTRIPQGPPTGRFALMVGCGVGERCGFSEDGSFFTRGLIEALSSMSAPRTVHEVYEAARSRTSRLAREHGLTQQRVQIRYGADQEEQTRGTRICAGRHLMDQWRAVVEDERLWQLVDPGSSGGTDLTPRLRRCLLALVENCARLVQHAQQRLPDPWVDDDFAPRLLLRALPRVVPASPALSAIEVATLIAAVFLREAAWADRLSQAAEAEPLVQDRLEHADAHRRHLEQVHDQHAHIARKLSSLLGKRRLDDRRDIGLWLVHRWIAERFETDAKPVPTGLVTGFAQAVLGKPEGDLGRAEELVVMLSRLAAGIGTDPPLDGPGEDAARKVRLPEGRQYLRERPLAALLRVAGALAVDVRTLPDVIAEHLGVSDAVVPGDVVTVLRNSLHWAAEGTSLHLDVSCPHQAIHAALEEVAERVDRLADHARRLADELPEPEARLLAGIPQHITANELRPRQIDSRKAYDVPLLRFQLAHTEVRELLMGRQLYGRPELAIRELYQNAMDACRYRAMRWKYLRRTDRHPALWHGQISVVQGADERGRYIECRDNGVGMGLEQLTNTFTRAGSRFEQSRLFRQEQATWLRHDPSLRLYPNSRFGIGVFSYFMLADEMTIVTRPVSREGVPAQEALRVEISSSGSLFRIVPYNEPGDNLPEGGTRVRLYVRDDVDLIGLSCVTTLRSLVAVSEFQLEARDSDNDPVEWEPGELYPLRAHQGKKPIAAVPGVLWWVDGEGAILCDGIATDKKPFGYVLNLTGAHAGTLSVNRTELQSYDQRWAERNWREGARTLPRWPGLTMEWLWNLDKQSLAVARVVWQELRGKGVEVSVDFAASCDLDAVGVLYTDETVMKSGNEQLPPVGQELIYLWPWRAAVLNRRFILRGEMVPDSLIGYPTPEPGDAACMAGNRNWTTMIIQASNNSMTVADVVRSLRRLRIASPRLAPPPAAVGDLSWVPDSVDTVIAEELAGGEMKRKMAGRNDLRGLVAASRRLHRPLGELVDICARYAPLRLAQTPEVPPYHQDHICTDEDVAMLYVKEGEGHSRRAWAVRHPAEVRDISLRTGVEPEFVLEHLARFQWLGWDIPDADDVRRWMLPNEDVFDMLRTYSTGQLLDWAATVVCAGDWDVPLKDAEEELAGWAKKIGLEYHPRLVEGSDACDHIPSAAAVAIIERACSLEYSVTEGLGIEELVISMPPEMTTAELLAASRELRVMGIPVPEGADLIAEWENLSLRTRYAFSGTDPTWEESDYPTEPTANVLFAASAELKERLADVWRLARSEAARFGMSVPTLPNALANFRPTEWESSALLASRDAETPKWIPLTIPGLARYAHDAKLNARAAYERLASLRPLGALVPELSAEAVRALEKSTPDKQDLVALGNEYRVTKAGEPLVALDLVSIAARLGEPISRTWQRIAPYLSLGPTPEVTAFPDVLPRWQDLAILSRYLDGKLPALSGRVDPVHVAFVATEVGETEAWIGERLRHYAGMFELDLSDLPQDGKKGWHG